MIINKEYSGGNINGDISLHGYLSSVRDEGDTTKDGYIGVENSTGEDRLYLSINDTSMGLRQSTSGGVSSILEIERATGALTSDSFVSKGGDRVKGDLIVDCSDGARHSFSITDFGSAGDGMNFYMAADFMGINGSVNGNYVTPFYISRIDNTVGSNHFMTSSYNVYEIGDTTYFFRALRTGNIVTVTFDFNGTASVDNILDSIVLPVEFRPKYSAHGTIGNYIIANECYALKINVDGTISKAVTIGNKVCIGSIVYIA